MPAACEISAPTYKLAFVSVAGPGGNISIVSDFFFASPDSLIEASSALGITGTVAISAPETDLSAGVTVLTSTLMDAAERLWG